MQDKGLTAPPCLHGSFHPCGRNHQAKHALLAGAVTGIIIGAVLLLSAMGQQKMRRSAPGAATLSPRCSCVPAFCPCCGEGG